MNKKGLLFFDVKSEKMKIFNNGKWEDFTLDPSYIQGTWGRAVKLFKKLNNKK